MKKLVIFVLCIMFCFKLVASELGDCYIAANCGTDTPILSVNRDANAHLSLNLNFDSYLKVCCPADFDMVPNSNPANCADALFKADNTNSDSHFARVNSASPYTSCLEVKDGSGTLYVPYFINGGDCSDLANRYCLFSTSGTVNAHVGSCDVSDPYTMRLCFYREDLPPPPPSNPCDPINNPEDECDDDSDCVDPDYPYCDNDPGDCFCYGDGSGPGGDGGGSGGNGYTRVQYGPCENVNDQGIGTRIDTIFYYNADGSLNSQSSTSGVTCYSFEENEPVFGTLSALLVVISLVIFYYFRRGKNEE